MASLKCLFQSIHKSMRNLIKILKTYSHEIGLGKGACIRVLGDFVLSRYRYGFGKQDYFVIGNGFLLSKYEKERFLTLRRAFKFQDDVNDKRYIHFLENKVDALNLFNDLVSRNWVYVPNATLSEFEAFVHKTPVFIAKPVGGMCGKGIEKYIVKDTSSDALTDLFTKFREQNMLLEECIKAHDDIFLDTTALSTFRIYTMIDSDGHVHVLKAKYRVGVGDSITDTSKGCVAYPVSIKYGVIEGPGINEVLNSNLYFYHPGCSKMVVGLKIPMWDVVLDVVTKAASKIPQVRYIGWDIAVTNTSVEIIEGNHNPYHGTFEIMGCDRLWWPKLLSLK